MKKIIAANFKSNLTIQEIEQYFGMLDTNFIASKDIELIIFPPAFALNIKVTNFSLGAQNAYGAKNGAFTGELTLDGLASLDIKYIMLGHSERRAMGENQKLLAQKFSFYKDAGFKIVYCIGEDLKTRQRGQASIEAMLDSQLDGIDVGYSGLIVAYEPIWAIGSGVSARVDDIERVHHFLHHKINAPLLYGGSVKDSNLKEILSIPYVNGVLVGSASLQVESFLKMIATSKEM